MDSGLGRYSRGVGDPVVAGFAEDYFGAVNQVHTSRLWHSLAADLAEVGQFGVTTTI